MIPPEVYALAEAWASIDGKLDSFHHPDDGTGHFEGYIHEAGEMIARLRTRGFKLVPSQSPDTLGAPGLFK